jgi:hypothetical protein
MVFMLYHGQLSKYIASLSDNAKSIVIVWDEVRPRMFIVIYQCCMQRIVFELLKIGKDMEKVVYQNELWGIC